VHFLAYIVVIFIVACETTWRPCAVFFSFGLYGDNQLIIAARV